MKMHPVEIAKELKQFQFFRSFPEDLLLQVATLVEVVQFPQGSCILQENEENKCLYFLRQGQAEVVLAGEVVMLLQNTGEVMGEMSVVTGKPASTTIRVLKEAHCFKINTDHFSFVPAKEKDHFLHLLYRIYSNILADRLVKTNEKARLFEIANRELHEAQVALHNTGEKHVLLVESDKKQLALAKVALGSTGVKLDTSPEVGQANGMLVGSEYDALVADETGLAFLRHAYDTAYPGKLVMMMTKDVSKNLSTIKSMEFVDHMITRDPTDRHFTIRTILTTLTKVLSNDLFGLEKYLTWGVEVQNRVVRSSRDREALREEMCDYFQKLGVRRTILDRVNTVSEELLMNAIYDAPTDSQGRAIYNHLPRTSEVLLDSHLQSSMHYASDGVFLAISVVDPFGALTKNVILRYLESNYKGEANLNEKEGKGGAGRGLHQIVENADLTIFNVKKGVRTEVICLFYVEGGKREPNPSFHYFFS
ncbi:MAG: cyclic nucleotide-binding domain-containing protein [Bdellovibrionaceae bacterium]|nr:cyclic nucleotide-binding domain-containing protein [Pseudobdellovibrionaceae bacterium]MBX3033074.1 cyclic nucleotide-binding domain-containing protein [Pseudobdellovibrionaceae bacterium]